MAPSFRVLLSVLRVVSPLQIGRCTLVAGMRHVENRIEAFGVCDHGEGREAKASLNFSSSGVAI